ncbi:MAG TPA: hypothetical protein VJ885_19255 [Thermoanaerobaculia bacterium]|nr:hypothetical protein [Thermoanaerobaculia bacterium]
MFRHLIRWGAAALLVVSFAQPARALPLGGAEEGFTLSFSALWEQLMAPLAEIAAAWEDTDGRGTCDPNGGICPLDESSDPLQGRGTCDPNGGGCDG